MSDWLGIEATKATRPMVCYIGTRHTKSSFAACEPTPASWICKSVGLPELPLHARVNVYALRIALIVIVD
jgi:hypothetical protein